MTSVANANSKRVVLSYSKNNSEFVSKVHQQLQSRNLPVWLDVDGGPDKNILKSQDDIVDQVAVVVCFLTPVYQASRHCQQQIELVKASRVPIVACRLLPNWKPSGWLNKVTNDQETIDFSSTNPKSFIAAVNTLSDKIFELLLNATTHAPLNGRSLRRPADPNALCLIEAVDSNDVTTRPTKSRTLSKECFNYLSPLMSCNGEYILINSHKGLHLFDGNLKLVRSSSGWKANESDLRDLSWCPYLNCFIVLSRKQVSTMNPLTGRVSAVEHIKKPDSREEFVACCCSEERLYLVTCQLNPYSFYLEQFHLPTFRFSKKMQMLDFIGNSFFIRNKSFVKFSSILQVFSIRCREKTLLIVMEIDAHWFLYVFDLSEQGQISFSKRISLQNKGRVAFFHPADQAILFKDHSSNSFAKMSLGPEGDLNADQPRETIGCCNWFLNLNGKIHAFDVLGASSLVVLVEDALVLYEF